jgi:hypothetical protein
LKGGGMVKGKRKKIKRKRKSNETKSTRKYIKKIMVLNTLSRAVYARIDVMGAFKFFSYGYTANISGRHEYVLRF